MDTAQGPNHSFILKVWLEETAQQASRALWRGHITHVPSGERRYVQDLGGVSAFVAFYLGQMGARLPLGWRIWQRWVKWTRRLRGQG